jgi:myosin heavy subunit
MSPAEKSKHDCHAILTCALAPLAEIDPKTGKPITIFCVGNTKSYFKMGALEFLESHRSAGLEVHAIQMQRVALNFLARRKIHGSQKARKQGVVMIQKWARRMIAKMRAKKDVEKARKEKEKIDAKRKKEREERELQARLEADLEDMEYGATKEYKKYEARLEELDGQLKDAKARFDERIQEAQERCNSAKEEAEELKQKLETELKFAAQEPAKQAAAQKTKLEESAKLIAFLQKENKKLSSANDKAKKEMKKVKETNEKLVSSNENAGQSFEMLNSNASKLQNNQKSINENIEKYKKENAKLREDLKARQAFYNAEAQIRLQYQKTLAQILDVFQDNCKDADLVEDVVCVALECESEAKSLLAAAEASAPGL